MDLTLKVVGFIIDLKIADVILDLKMAGVILDLKMAGVILTAPLSATPESSRANATSCIPPSPVICTKIVSIASPKLSNPVNPCCSDRMNRGGSSAVHHDGAKKPDSPAAVGQSIEVEHSYFS